MLRVAINGFGRIGRSVLRVALGRNDIQVVAINDQNPDPKNIAYMASYDSIYGRDERVLGVANGHLLLAQGAKIPILSSSSILDSGLLQFQPDVVVEATGVSKVVEEAKFLASSECRFVVTHCAPDIPTLTLGANDFWFVNRDIHIWSAGICDSTAIAPVLKVLHDNVGIDGGFVTTLHPALGYQNVLDGPSSSWSVPGEIHHHYALGRSMLNNLIPKPTSAIDACNLVLASEICSDVASFSYRVPTSIVGSADLSLRLSRKTTEKEVVDMFSEAQRSQDWDIFKVSDEPLVSVDFIGSPYSAVIDRRWISISGGDMLKVVLWYDNEQGYVERVIDQMKFISPQVSR